MGRKHKRRKTPTKNKPKTIKKTLIGSHILIITLNVSGLNAPTKYIHEAKGMEGKASACNAGDRDDPLEKEVATHSSILAWEIPWTEKPDRLWSMGL